MLSITMIKATVRDLRYGFPAVLSRLEHGETIAITKRGKVVARLSPAGTPRRKKTNWRGFFQRMKERQEPARDRDNLVEWFIQERDRDWK